MAKGKPDRKLAGGRLRKLAIALVVIVVLAIATVFLFQRAIGNALFDRAIEQRLTGNAIDLPDGLHLALCGTGSPLPNPDRAGPCAAVVAGEQTYIVDIGEGGARNLNLMGFDLGAIDAVLLTHFHSDHVDGLGPLALLHWTQGTRDEPLAVYGPTGVEELVEGFNGFYAQDHAYRIAHHGTDIVPENGGGARAIPFAVPTEPTVLFVRDGLTVSVFPVDHDPVASALGYRFDYKGRSIVISGDTAQSAMLERASIGADLLLHEALQPRMVGAMTTALDNADQPHTAQITRDILDYHASPEEAAESAQRAGVKMLVLTHLVPPIPSRFFYPAFLGDAGNRFDGEIIVGEDGMVFSLLPGETSVHEDDRL